MQARRIAVSIAAFALPVVRTRRLPPPTQALQWRETGDLPAGIVVLAVAAVGVALAVAVMTHATRVAHGMDPALLLAALALLSPCAIALLAAIAELTRVHTIAINNAPLSKDSVRIRKHALGCGFEHIEPLHRYEGLLILDRTRRLFIRNQDHPLTGRRGPVTEFVIVLRHQHDRALDVELFRAQPSLETLFAMHRMQDAMRGRASSANAGACVELAASYRQALSDLCAQLDKPVLIASAGGTLREWPVETLDEWLHPPS